MLLYLCSFTSAHLPLLIYLCCMCRPGGCPAVVTCYLAPGNRGYLRKIYRCGFLEEPCDGVGLP